MPKTAIVVFSDPKGGEEALGRVLNAMFLTLEVQDRGDEAALVFQGTGTRWPAVLNAPDHPGHALYQAVRPAIAGVCGACADVFGATESLAATGLVPVRDRAVLGVEGLLDLTKLTAQGYTLVTF